MRRLLPLVIVVVAACTSGGGDPTAHLSSPTNGPVQATTGLTAPDTAGDPVPDTTFTRFDGTVGSLADYAGKPLVINWFSTWCAPCVREMPALEQVHEEFGDKVAFLGLNNQDTLADGKTLADKTGVTWDLARDPTGAILAEFKGIAMPTTVLVSSSGHIVATHSGEITASALEQLIKDKLLA